MANQKFRTEVNVINLRKISTTYVAEERCYFDPADFNGETVYFEIVGKNSNVSAQDVFLRDSSNNVHATISVPPPPNADAIYRVEVSTPLTADDYHLYWTSDDIDIEKGGLVILQDAETITDTVVYAEIVEQDLIVAAEPPVYVNGYPKFWYYDSEHWDPVPTAYVHFTYKTETNRDDFLFKVQYTRDFITWTDCFAGVQINPGVGDVLTHHQSASFTLQDKAWHKLVWSSENDKKPATILNGQIVLKQSDVGGIIKSVPEMLMQVTAYGALGNQEWRTRYDPAEWNVEGGYIHFVACMDCQDDTDSLRIEYLVNVKLDGSTILGAEPGPIDHQTFSIQPGSLDLGPPTAYDIGSGCDDLGVAQRYTPDNGKIIGFLVCITKVGSPGDLTIELRNDDTNLPGSTLHASATILAADISTTKSWHFILFDTPYDTNSANDLWCCLVHTGGSASDRYDVYAASAGRDIGAIRNGSWASSTDEFAISPTEAMDMPGSTQDLYHEILAASGTLLSTRILVFYYFSETTDLSISIDTEEGTIGVTDVPTVLLPDALQISIAEGIITVTDVPTVEVPGPTLEVDTFEGPITVTDVVDDMLVYQETLEVSISEPLITVTDVVTDIAQELVPSVFDEVTVTDIVTDLAFELVPSVFDGVTVLEDVTVALPDALEISVAETAIVVTDVVDDIQVVSPDLDINVYEEVTVTDAVDDVTMTAWLYTDFSEYGDGTPADWTERWHTDVAAPIIESGGPLGGKRLLLDYVGGSQRYMCSWDDPGLVKDVEILVCIVNTGDDNMRLTVRGSGDDTSEEGYMLRGDASDDKIYYGYYDNASWVAIGDFPFTLGAGTRTWIRFRMVGVALKIKAWKYGDPEPGAWTVDTTDGTLTAAGWVGAGLWLGDSQLDFFSVATHGATAIAFPEPIVYEEVTVTDVVDDVQILDADLDINVFDEVTVTDVVDHIGLSFTIWTDFSEYSLGDPGDWTEYWNTNQCTFTIADATTIPSPISGKYLYVTYVAEFTDYGLGWDDVGTPRNVEVLFLLEVDGSNCQEFVIRGSGAEGSENAYSIRPGTSNQVYLYRRLSGAAGSIGAHAHGFGVGTLLWLRFSAQGNDLKFKVWTYGQLEGAGWDVEVTDDNGILDGWIGVLQRTTFGGPALMFLSIGAYGEAPIEYPLFDVYDETTVTDVVDDVIVEDAIEDLEIDVFDTTAVTDVVDNVCVYDIYVTDFSEYTENQQPSDWTEEWNVGNATALAIAGGEYGGQFLRLDHSETFPSGSRYAASWDDISGETDGEVLALIRSSTVHDNVGVVLRGGGGIGTEDAYLGFASFWNDPYYVRIMKLVNGSYTVVSAKYEQPLAIDTWYWFRFQVRSTALKLKVWELGTSEPAGWHCEDTDANLSSGWAGVFSNYDDARDCDYFAFASGACATVPMPADLTPQISEFDTTTVTDNVTVSLPDPLVIDVFDTTTVTDVLDDILILGELFIDVFDATGVTEDITAELPYPLAIDQFDEITVTDSETVQVFDPADMLISEFDLVTVTEDITALLPYNLLISVFDTTPVTDEETVFVEGAFLEIDVYETVTVEDVTKEAVLIATPVGLPVNIGEFHSPLTIDNPQAIAHGLGTTPNLIILTSIMAVDQTAESAHNLLTYGAMDSQGNELAHGYRSDDNAPAGDTRCWLFDNGKIIYMDDGDGSTLLDAIPNAALRWDDTHFYIDWQTVDASNAYRFNFVAIAGLAKIEIGNFTQRTGTGLQDVVLSGGFQPDALLVMSGPGSLNTVQDGLNYSQGGGNQLPQVHMQCIVVVDGADPTNADQWGGVTLNPHIIARIASGAGNELDIGDLTAVAGWPYNGFEIDWDTNNEDELPIAYIAIGGVDSYIDWEYSPGDDPAPPVDFAVTGVGFQGQLVMLLGAGGWASILAHATIQKGFAKDAATEYSLATRERDNASTSVCSSRQRSNRFFEAIWGWDGALGQSAEFKQWDSDGFTLTFQISTSDFTPWGYMVLRQTTEFSVAVYDTTAVTEQVTVALPDALEIDVFESAITVTDVPFRTLVHNVSVFSETTVVEDITVRVDFNPSVFDATGVTEQVTVALPDALEINLFDGSVVTEWTDVDAEAPGVLYASVFDAVTVQEDITASLPDPLKASVFDLTSVTELVIASLPDDLETSVFDLIGVTESVTVAPGLKIDIFDGATVLESVTVELTDLQLSVFDTVTVTGDVTVQLLVPTNLYVDVYESVTVTEATAGIIGTVILSIFDEITVTDAVEVYWLLSVGRLRMEAVGRAPDIEYEARLAHIEYDERAPDIEYKAG